MRNGIENRCRNGLMLGDCNILFLITFPHEFQPFLILLLLILTMSTTANQCPTLGPTTIRTFCDICSPLHVFLRVYTPMFRSLPLNLIGSILIRQLCFGQISEFSFRFIRKSSKREYVYLYAFIHNP